MIILRSNNNYNTQVKLGIYEDSWTVIPPFGKIEVKIKPEKLPDGVIIMENKTK